MITKADLRLRSGDLVGAKEAFQRAVELDPDASEVKDFAERLRTAPVAEARREADQDMDRADALLRAGDLDGATSAFRRAVSSAPDSPGVKALARRLKDAPAKNAPSAYARADSLVEAGFVDEAGDAYEHALALDPARPEAGRVGKRLREVAERRDKATREAMLERYRVEARGRMKDGDYDAAYQALMVAIAVDPESAETLVIKREIYSKRPPSADVATTVNALMDRVSGRR